MGSLQYIPRLEPNKLVLYKNVKSESSYGGRISDDHDNPKKIDFNRPFKVFLTDGVSLYEIYSSKKDKANENENELYVDQAEEGIKRRRLQVVSDSQRNQQVPPNHTQSNQNNQIEEFPLTGPVGDVVVSGGFFRVIIHQEDTDDNPDEFDDSHLLHAYACGEIVSQSDVVFTAYPDETLYHEREGLFTCNIFLSVGMLTLSCVFLNVSRLVTVRVKWLHDATEITGGLFLSSFKDHKSALFETPKGKAIKVTYGQLIPLLRSTFAVIDIDGSSFTFDANVSSAHGGSLSVINSVTFENDDFSEVNNFTKSRVIDCGGGGKMQVVVTMKPNVLDYNRKHRKAHREVCAKKKISWPLALPAMGSPSCVGS